jgi:hypothetical protein
MRSADTNTEALKVANERYKIMCALYEAARRNLGSGSLYLLSPSTKGKSDTIKIFIRDHPQSKVVRAGTTSFLYEILSRAVMNGIFMFFIDDRTRWVRTDFNDGISYLKMLGEGVLCHQRGTKFSMEEDSIPCTAVCVLSLNYMQGDTSYMRLQEIGFLDRALKLRVTHTDEEYNHILAEYKTYGYGRKLIDGEKLPYYKMPENFFKPEGDEKVDPMIEKWITENYKSAIRKTVWLIAQVLTTEAFEELKPILRAGLQDTEFKERVEFDHSRDAPIVQEVRA